MTETLPAPGMAAKTSLVGLSRPGLAAALAALGVPERQAKMRSDQLWHWMYVRGVTDFAAMTNMSKDFRATLAAAHTVSRPEIVTEQISEDGTRKWLLRFPPRGAGRPVEVETVYIPEEGRGTLCLSSQVGCTLSCTFCHTGTQTLVRNLTAGRDRRAGPARPRPPRRLRPHGPGDGDEPSGRLVSNIVMMGMGEPLYNFENVRDALLIAADGDGIALSRRRITLSTSGVVPMIARAGEEIGVMLAISLHAVRDDLRDELVPLNRKYPIAELLAACRAYPGLSNARRITFEYVMLKGVNDSPVRRARAGPPARRHPRQDQPHPVQSLARREVRMLRLGAQIERFAEIVNRAGYASPIRTPRGRDILAACGQLKSETERLRIRERMALEAMIAG